MLQGFYYLYRCSQDLYAAVLILDICPRVEGEKFTELQIDDDALTFLINLGYKGPLHKYTNMYVDHMSQPWMTLAAIINKCLSGKTASNDRLRKSRIDIMWGMFYRENVDYHELIWKDFAYQINHMRERNSRRENMPYPRFTKVIINHFLIQHKSLSNLKYQHYHTIKDDGIIPPKKSRGKGSQGKKTVNDSQETVDVSEDSEHEPEPVKKKTASRRVVKKKVIISANDNIIPDPDVALELGKSISLAEAEAKEAAKQVHDTHARIVTESAKKKTVSRSSRSVVIQDTPNIMQALKESKKTSKRQPGAGGSSEGTATKPGVPDEEKVITEEKVILEWGSEQESEYSEKDQLDDEEKDDKEGDVDDEGDDHISDTKDTDDEDDET
ncbi:hypothetical protein Tco_1556204 [Tanacetum coccineum]